MMFLERARVVFFPWLLQSTAFVWSSLALAPAKSFCSSPVHTLQPTESIWHLQTHVGPCGRCGWRWAAD